MVYRPMRPGSPIHLMYRSVLRASFAVYRFEFAGRSRLETAEHQVVAAFGADPDRDERKRTSEMVALAVTIAAFLAVTPLTFVMIVLKAYWAAKVVFILYSVVMGWVVVVILRATVDGLERRRWERSGRPEGAMPRGMAQPKDRDIAYALVISVWIAAKFLALFP